MFAYLGGVTSRDKLNDRALTGVVEVPVGSLLRDLPARATAEAEVSLERGCTIFLLLVLVKWLFKLRRENMSKRFYI